MTQNSERNKRSERNERACKIKICGIVSTEDALLLCEEHVDYIGMVLFYEKSKRNVTIEQAKQLIEVIRRHQCNRVTERRESLIIAVTVSPTLQQLRWIEAAGFDGIQIHKELYSDVYQAANIPIIKAIQIPQQPDGDEKEECHHIDSRVTEDTLKTVKREISTYAAMEKIQGILIDSKEPGSGKRFDWTMLHQLNQINRNEKMLFLAGGLNAENVGTAIKKIQPDVIDVSSGVEYSENLKKLGKDPLKVRRFLGAVRNNNQNYC